MVILVLFEAVSRWYTWRNRAHVLPFSRPSCYFKTRLPSCALGTSFYTVSEGRDLMTHISDNYTSYGAPSPLTIITVKMVDTFACLLRAKKTDCYVCKEFESWIDVWIDVSCSYSLHLTLYYSKIWQIIQTGDVRWCISASKAQHNVTHITRHFLLLKRVWPARPTQSIGSAACDGDDKQTYRTAIEVPSSCHPHTAQ